MILRYLSIPYMEGGRDASGADCYGVVRLVRHEVYGLPLLPSHSEVSPADKEAMTAVCREIVSCADLQECAIREAAIATAYAGRRCVHVGIVIQADGRLWILETDTPGGPCLTPIRTFENRYTCVKYYD